MPAKYKLTILKSVLTKDGVGMNFSFKKSKVTTELPITKGAAATVGEKGKWGVLALKNRVLGVLVFLILLTFIFSIMNRNFATVSNADTIILNASILVIMACAEAVVLLTRNYDVSVASILALTAYVGFDLFAKFPQIGPIMILIPLLIGALCGALNGLLVGYGKLSSIIVTLGALSVYRGLAIVYAQGRQIEPKDVPYWVKESITGNLFFGLSTLVVIAVIVVVGIAVYLYYTRTGRQIYAVGSNPDAAIFYGLKKPRIVFQAYVICGTLTGLAGFLFGARASYVVPYFANGMEMQVLAAAVVGGVSVLGGSGNVIGAAVGAVVMATIENGLILLGASDFVRQFIAGALIVFAVVMDAAILAQVQNLLKSKRRRGGMA
jgi:rhamnose transport system permease protein